MQIKLFKNVEEIIELCGCKCLEKFLRKRFKQEYTVERGLLRTKLAFLWGDEIKDIIRKCRREEVYNYVQLYVVTALQHFFI